MKSGRHLHGTHRGPGVERRAGSRLRWNFHSSLHTKKHPDGVLTIAAEKNWEVLQLGVQTAFLIANMKGATYVAEAPVFFTTGGAPQVVKLLKSLYGLPDSHINWWNTIDPYLLGVSIVEKGFEPLKSDTCVYIC